MNSNLFITIFTCIFSSVGFWTLINNLIVKKQERKSESTKLLLGLAHDRICDLCLEFIRQGSITSDDYENLIKYLYEPYKTLGGNGTAERLIAEVKKLPIVERKGIV